MIAGTGKVDERRQTHAPRQAAEGPALSEVEGTGRGKKGRRLLPPVVGLQRFTPSLRRRVARIGDTAVVLQATLA